jgi:hypothetical protein
MANGGAIALAIIIGHEDIRKYYVDILYQFYCGRMKKREVAVSLFDVLEKKVRLKMTTVLLKTICEKTSGAVKFDPNCLSAGKDQTKEIREFLSNSANHDKFEKFHQEYDF